MGKMRMDELYGSRISKARKARGMNQEDVASLMGVSGAAVSQWENGQTKPRDFKRLAALLGVTEVWLTDGVGDVDFKFEGSDELATSDVTHTVLMASRVDTSTGKAIPLILLVQPSKGNVITMRKPTETKARRFVHSMFPCGDNSFAVQIVDNANEPDLQVGDRCVFDPSIDIVPKDFIVAELTESGDQLIRQIVFGENGEVILQAASGGWPLYRFTAEEWPIRVKVLGVMSEHSRPRRA
jgi:transcriptional regulator with XRE-family HTH domain